MNVSEIEPKVKLLFQDQWKILEPHLNSKSAGPGKTWDFSTTPPFPKTWPAKENGYIYYAYLSRPGFAQGISDGQLIGKIWGSVSVTPKNGSNELLFSPFPGDAIRYEIQGVRPLTAQESVSLEIDPLSALQASDQTMLKHYYCTWVSLNGVIFSSISAKHSDFFSFLNCTKGEE